MGEGQNGFAGTRRNTPDGTRVIVTSNAFNGDWDVLDSKNSLFLWRPRFRPAVSFQLSPNARRAIETEEYSRAPRTISRIKVWELDNGKELITFEKPGGLGAVAVPDGGDWLVTTDGPALEIRDLNTGEIRAAFTCDAAFDSRMAAIGNTIIASDHRRRVHLLRLENPLPTRHGAI